MTVAVHRRQIMFYKDHKGLLVLTVHISLSLAHPSWEASPIRDAF